MTATDDGKHCAPDRRVPKVEGIWVTLCGCYSGDCVQLAMRLEDETIGVRKSSEPDNIVWFDAGEFYEFLDAVRDPSRNVLQEAMDALGNSKNGGFAGSHGASKRIGTVHAE